MDMNLRVLKAKIKGLEAEGRRIRKKIERSEGTERDRLWRLKRELGYVTRCHLLAYALLRGKPYAAVERKSLFQRQLPLHVREIILQNATLAAELSWSVETVEAELSRPLPETRKPEKRSLFSRLFGGLS